MCGQVLSKHFVIEFKTLTRVIVHFHAQYSETESFLFWVFFHCSLSLGFRRQVVSDTFSNFDVQDTRLVKVSCEIFQNDIII